MAQPTYSVESNEKCSACQIVMDELELAVEAEKDDKDRMDLDMLARLDSTGKRRGKVVNYELSEVKSIR
jgi:hypothetical protein